MASHLFGCFVYVVYTFSFNTIAFTYKKKRPCLQKWLPNYWTELEPVKGDDPWKSDTCSWYISTLVKSSHIQKNNRESFLVQNPLKANNPVSGQDPFFMDS